MGNMGHSMLDLVRCALGLWRKMGLWFCTCLLTVLFQFPLTLAITNDGDAAALRALSSNWEKKPFNWDGSDPCGSPWVGIGCTNSRVTSITLSSMGLKGTLPGDIQSLTELQTLDLSYNVGLGGNLPPSIGTLSNLTTLILVGCSFSGQIPDLGSLQQLVFLSLNSNQFTGVIPPSIGKLSKLYWLDLADNKLRGTIPVSSENSPGLDMLIHTKHFHFGKNQLSDSIPEQLFSSEMQLIHLLFDNNALSGSIPSTLGLVKTLEVIRLDRNSLIGHVPTNINNLTAVGELHLSDNKLTGPLPNLSGMNALSYVVVEYARIGNSLPQSLFTLPQLQTVRLRNNFLNGTLDLGTNYTSSLQLIDLQSNKIEGFLERKVFKNQLMLMGNPFCDQRGSNYNHCTTQPQSAASYSTPTPNCQQTDCSSDQNLSPNCKCAYPYVGTLYFRAPSFSDLGNSSRYQALEKQLLTTFQSHNADVDSVALHDSLINSDNYLQIDLQVFPAVKARFNQSDISVIGFILSNQTFKPPKYFGPFYFLGRVYNAAQDTSGSKFKNLPVIIGAFVGGLILVLIVIGLIAYAIGQKRKAERVVEQSQPFASWDGSKGSGGVPQLKGPRWFSFDEMKKSTNNFSEANDIGSGGYGKVYRGMLVTGQLVAIKRAQQGSVQGGLEFKTEIELLSRVHHKNLVALVGFCFDQGEQMLVYEYVPNGSLRESLSGKSGIHLDWRRRLQIALGTARGLAYLHELADPPIIHRDIKSNNILLDERLNAKVADFGLCKPMTDGQKDHITTQVKGTMGYLDPEYYMTQQLTDKSDVYGFGVLLLELITARRPIEKGRYIVREVRNLIDRKKDCYNLHGVLDPSMGLPSSLTGFEKFVDLAMQCVEESGAERPAMSQAVKEIEGIMLLAGMNPNAESAHTSASYEGTSKDHPMHPYGGDSFDYSAGVPSSKIEPK
ncbi:hypothetical protein Taro_043451 [Colocasia esculenta]|uniref:non-specific serine/threonine protein kinase n=1 Tax=Colocasia esculenta TaxID=4460 RepID=A0A843WL70_COLES|nr:hypothetical protein [Colocasia esculenta]